MHGYTLYIFSFFAMCAFASAFLEEALINMLKGVVDEGPDPEEAMNLVKSNLLTEKHLREKVSGETALHVSLKLRYEDIALELIKISRDVNIENDSWDTPLQLAVDGNLKTCVKELIKKGAFLESRNTSGLTPLFRAILKNKNLSRGTPLNANVVKMLLDAGASPHAKDGSRNIPAKPMHYAARDANAPLMELLLSRGVDVNEGHMNGRGDFMRPLDYVMQGTYPKQKTSVIVCLNNGAEETDENPFEIILKKFWMTSQDETFEGLDDYVLRNIEENLPRDSMEVDEDVPPSPKNNAKPSFLSATTKIFPVFSNSDKKIWDLVGKYDEEGMFAFYRILKWRYVEILRGKPQSNLEKKVLDIFNSLLTRILENTYLGKMPLKIAADAFSSVPLYYSWKVQRYAFNFALAAHYLNLNDEEVKDAAFRLFAYGEGEGTNAFSYEEQCVFMEKLRKDQFYDFLKYRE